jgi:hypothetical protein
MPLTESKMAAVASMTNAITIAGRLDSFLELPNAPPEEPPFLLRASWNKTRLEHELNGNNPSKSSHFHKHVISGEQSFLANTAASQ